ncbi:MAG: hypothetical protein ABUL44_04590, partial [Flavobacterium sp.]
MNKRHLGYLLFFLLAGTLMLYFSFLLPLSDYGNYYYGSKFLAAGKFSAAVYDPWSFNQMIQAAGHFELYENYTPVPPFSLVAYLPFVFFDPETSKFIFGCFSLLILTFVLLNGNKRDFPIDKVYF